MCIFVFDPIVELRMEPHESREWLDITLPFTHSYQERVFRSWFGMPPQALPILWGWIIAGPTPKKWGAVELLICLNFLKSPGINWGEYSTRFHRTEKTAKKWLWESLQLLNNTLPEVLFSIFIAISFIMFKLSMADQFQK